jgi:hypothetical protein
MVSRAGEFAGVTSKSEARKMSSQRRIEASRANGARSLGPVTAEGKERSARNALRHGLLASTVVLEAEDGEEFQEALAALVARFQPADPVELGLVEEMAAAQWRKRRSWAIETCMMNTAVHAAQAGGPVERITQAFTGLAAGPELALLHRYETRQTRMYQRALQNLLALRKEKAPNEPNPNSEHGLVMDEPPAAPEPAPQPVDLPVAAAPRDPAPVEDVRKPPASILLSDFAVDDFLPIPRSGPGRP